MAAFDFKNLKDVEAMNELEIQVPHDKDRDRVTVLKVNPDHMIFELQDKGVPVNQVRVSTNGEVEVRHRNQPADLSDLARAWWDTFATLNPMAQLLEENYRLKKRNQDLELRLKPRW
jgi:phage gp29-like protein